MKSGTLSDIVGLFAAKSGVQAASSGAPPKWAKSAVAKLAPGEDFDLYWQREREQREAAANEDVMPARRR